MLSADISNWVNNCLGGFTGLWATSAAGAVLDDYSAGNVACSSLFTPTPAPTSTPVPTATSSPGSPGLCPFPAVGVADNFNRPDGTSLLGAWFGGITNYAVANNQLSVNGTGDSLMAWNSLLGSDQEASVKIASYNASSSAIRLFLKVQDGNLGSPHILVGYLPSQNRIQVLTYDPAVGFLERGSYPITLQPGDVLGARALSTGFVDAFINGNKVLSADITNWVNNALGGFTGLWTTNAAGTVLDDYSAGNVACSAAPTSTPGAASATPTPTPTATPPLVPPGLCPFPAVGVSDDFNRPDGTSLVGAWFGGVSNFAVANNQLSINGAGDSLMAWNSLLGTDQEASVRIASYNASSSAIRLFLKVADGNLGNAHILVGYLPSQNRIQVLTFEPGIGFLERGSYPVTLQPGDVLGARALSAGFVEAYVNSNKVLNINISGWVNNAAGGFTGLWATSAAGAVLDNYAAGNVACTIAATPTSTPGAATVTPTPTATSTPVPGTATATPTATSTPVPGTATATRTPTATSTPVPGTATATRTPTATSTPVPGTATATRTPTATSTPLPGPQVTSFTLINADTDQPVPGYDPIPNNATINLTTLGVPRINVRANVSGPVVSVRFGLNSNTNYRTENTSAICLGKR